VEERHFDVRDLLGAVNVRDFIDMVGAEIGHIGTSAGLAVRALTRLPFGPFAFVVGMAIVGLRSCLLVLVVIVFGGGILAVSAARTLLGLMGRRTEPGGDTSEPSREDEADED